MPFDPEAYPVSPTGIESLSQQFTQQQRVDAAFEAMSDGGVAEEVQQEVDLMTEARIRFAKAALYEQIIQGALFEGDDPVTLSVEEEFKTFAEERLRILLGIDTESQGSKGSKFDIDEMGVLKLFAAKLLGKPASIPRPDVQPARLAAPKPVAPVQQPLGQLAAPKRGRGRPPGTGKHQRAAAAQTEQSVRPAPLQRQHAPTPAVPQNQAPAGKLKDVTLSNGEVRTVSIQRGQVREPPNPYDRNGPKPMPSPDEMIAQAQAHGEMGLRNFNSEIRNPDTHIVTPTHTIGQ